jgi:hypothetical protein
MANRVWLAIFTAQVGIEGFREGDLSRVALM